MQSCDGIAALQPRATGCPRYVAASGHTIFVPIGDTRPNMEGPCAPPLWVAIRAHTAARSAARRPASSPEGAPDHTLPQTKKGTRGGRSARAADGDAQSEGQGGSRRRVSGEGQPLRPSGEE